MDQYAAALIGLAGALSGVAIQWALGRVSAHSERRRELLVDAYQKFIDATAALAAEARMSSTRDAAAWANIIASKQRIAYFAPADVVAALAQFGRTSQVLGEADADAAFGALLKAMRASIKLRPVEDADLFQVLLGKDGPG